MEKTYSFLLFRGNGSFLPLPCFDFARLVVSCRFILVATSLLLLLCSFSVCGFMPSGADKYPCLTSSICLFRAIRCFQLLSCSIWPLACLYFSNCSFHAVCACSLRCSFVPLGSCIGVAGFMSSRPCNCFVAAFGTWP